MKTTHETYIEMVQEVTDKARSEAARIACSGLWPRFYLYCSPSTERENGRLYLVSNYDKADKTGLQLVTGESLPPNLPLEKYFQWTYDRARQAPLFAWGK